MTPVGKQALSVLILSEIITPVLTCVFVLTLRLYVLITNSVPEFVQSLNRNFFIGAAQFKPSEVTGGLLYVCFFFVYPIGKFIMAFTFWQISQVKKPAKTAVIKWIATTLLLSSIGIFLIFPLQAHALPETGLCILFLIINSVFSFVSSFYLIGQLYMSKSGNATIVRNFLDSPLLTTKV